MGNPHLLYSRLLVLVLSRTILATTTWLQSTTPINGLTNMVVHNDTIYMAGDGTLNVIDMTTLADKRNEVKTCAASGDSNKCNNVNKVLLVNDRTNELIMCGTGNSGACQVRSLTDLDKTIDVEQGPKALYVSTDADRPAFGFLYPGSTKMIIGITNGDSLGGDNLYPLSIRLTEKKDDDDIFNSKQQLPSFTDYLVYFRKGFQINGFSYFVTNQKRYTGDYPFVTKLIRICQNDTSSECNSYADIELSCTKEGTLYNLIQDAVVVETTEGQVFVGVFTKGSNPETPSGDNMICTYNLDELNSAILQAKKDFFTCKNPPLHENKRYLRNDRNNCFPGEVPPTDIVTCSSKVLQSYKYVIGTTPTNLNYSNAIAADKGHVTKLYSRHVSGSIPDIHAGTSRGHIIKMNLNAGGKLEQYESVIISTSKRPIKAIHTDDDDGHYYVMTTEKLYKYNETDCSEYKNCSDTMLASNPLCGWCILKEKSTLKSSCNDKDNWLSPLKECVKLEVTPKGKLIGDSVLEVTVKIHNFQPPTGSHVQTFICKYIPNDVLTSKQEFPATKDPANENEVKCAAPNVAVHTEGTLQLYYGNILLGTTDFLFYDCDHYKTCGKCTPAEIKCKWCPSTLKCLSTVCDVSISTTAECPKMTHTPDLYAHTGIQTKLEFNAINLDNSTTLLYYCEVQNSPYRAVVSATTIECTLSINSLKKDVDITVKYGKDINSLVDLDGNNKVTVYKCEDLVNDCTRCGALNCTRYQCKWDDRCIYSPIVAAPECPALECPAPNITKIVPNDGHIEGGTNVNISGTDLGVALSDIKSIEIGNVNCSLIKAISYKENMDFSKAVTKQITCKTGKINKASIFVGKKATINVKVGTKIGKADLYTYQQSTISHITPVEGPQAGGTLVTVYGQHLGIGNRELTARFDGHIMMDTKLDPFFSPDIHGSGINFTVQFKTPNLDKQVLSNIALSLASDDAIVVAINGSVNFTVLDNPIIDAIPAQKGILSGGLSITITGEKLRNANVGMTTATYGGKTTTSICSIESDTMMKCPAPKAPESLKDQMRRKRRKRDTGCNCIESEIIVNLDGVQATFKLTYYNDPSLEEFETRVFETNDQKLTLSGKNLNLAVTENDISITIGLENCTVIELTEDTLTCLAPVNQPKSGIANSKVPEVNVTMGNLNWMVGYLKYQEQQENDLKLALIISGAVVGVLLAIVLIVVFIGCQKYRTQKHKAQKFESSLNEMEMEIKTVAREEFLDMHSSMSGVNKNLVEMGFPYQSYQRYAFTVMFPSEFGYMDEHPLLHEPVVSNGKVSDNTRIKMKKSMDTLEKLIHNKFFIISVISTMEKQRKFFLKEKSTMVGNLCAILLGRMDYLHEILGILLTNLIQETDSKKTQRKILFRRCESITEKLLSSWLSLTVYQHVTEQCGSHLYLLLKATQLAMESGPIDAVTNDSKYTLTEDKLLKKWSNSADDGTKDPKTEAKKDPKTEYKTLTLNVVVDNGEEIYMCKVLDCDTITQVKRKCLNQIYVNYHASTFTIDIQELELQWHSGFSGSLSLRDRDNTSKMDGEYYRLNTLAHYNVQDESNMALIDPKCNNQLEDYVNLAQINMEPNMGCNGSVDSMEPLTNNSHDAENPLEHKPWHLVKPEVDTDKPQKSAIDELYFNRLFKMKSGVLEYIQPLFDSVLDTGHCPPPVKYLYDFLDDIGDRYKVDSDILHAWKSHSYAIRVLAPVIRGPGMLFDVAVPPYVETSMEVMSHVFIDSFSLSQQKLTKESAPHKLIFIKETTYYQEKIKEFFKNTKLVPSSPETLQKYLVEVNKQQQQKCSFNRMSALYRFYQQLQPYMDDIIDDLSMNKEAKSLNLQDKLESVVSTMEEET